MQKPTSQKKAKIFPNGHSQAVRLPQAFRFTGEEVIISSHGNSVLLSPISIPVDKLPKILQEFDPSFHIPVIKQVILGKK
jgi:antitoxin VapB